jgi:hypothetical protein
MPCMAGRSTDREPRATACLADPKSADGIGTHTSQYAAIRFEG